jgi:hypothetical protein
MLKKFLLTTYLLALTSTPTQAYPIWATAIAKSQCEYFAMGFDLETAIEYSLRDNLHWSEEFLNSKVAARVIVYAVHEMCPNLQQKAIEGDRQNAQPAYNENRYQHL